MLLTELTVLEHLPACYPPCPPACRYKLDSSFLRLPASEVLTLLQTSLKSLKDRQTTLQDEKTQCETEMDELKAILYAKFGSEFRGGFYSFHAHTLTLERCVAESINLERGDD